MIEPFRAVIEAAPGVTVLPCPFRGGASIVSVIVLDAGELALVDAGVPETQAEMIEPFLAKRGKSVGDVRKILITHADGDHAGSVPGIRAVGAAMKPPRPATVVCQQLSANRMNITDGEIVEDGDSFEAGGRRWTAIYTPGHRQDFLSFYQADLKLCIVSDAVQASGTPWARFPLIGYSGRAVQTSAKKLLTYDIQTMILGHPYGWSGEAGWVRRGAECQQFLRETIAVAEEIEQTVAAELAKHGAARRQVVIDAAVKGLMPKYGYPLDANGAPPAAVITSIEAVLGDLGAAPA